MIYSIQTIHPRTTKLSEQMNSQLLNRYSRQPHCQAFLVGRLPFNSKTIQMLVIVRSVSQKKICAFWIFPLRSSGRSFLIRDSDGFLHAIGDVTSHSTIVQNVNGMEMLKIIERTSDLANVNWLIIPLTVVTFPKKRSVDRFQDSTVHTFTVIHNHDTIGTVKVPEKSSPYTSLQIFDRSGSAVVVKSLIIGDYAVS